MFRHSIANRHRAAVHYVEHCCRGSQGDARIMWHAQTVEQLLDFAPARLFLFAADVRLLGGNETNVRAASLQTGVVHLLRVLDESVQRGSQHGDLLRRTLLKYLLFGVCLLVGSPPLRRGFGQRDHLILQRRICLCRGLEHVAHLAHLSRDLANLRRRSRSHGAAPQPSRLSTHARARYLHRRRPADAHIATLETEQDGPVFCRLIRERVELGVHGRLERQGDGDGRLDADQALQVALVRLDGENNAWADHLLEQGVPLLTALKAPFVKLSLQHDVNDGLDARVRQEEAVAQGGVGAQDARRKGRLVEGDLQVGVLGVLGTALRQKLLDGLVHRGER